MIRQILRLSIEALKVEANRWLHPEPAGAPAPVVAPVVESKWSCSKLHTEALKSTSCPECNGPKKVNWYMCDACRKPAMVSSGGSK